MLPFLIPRLYRPLMLEAWHLTNTDIGAAFSAYGFAAMLSYILGGPTADKYQPRLLMTTSLVATALGGLILLLFPSRFTFISVYFFFGISTIFLMWGALIKVTHITGGEENRSLAMGALDSGRGLAAAVMSSALVFIISLFYGQEQLASNTVNGLNIIYYTVIVFTLFISLGVWYTLKNHQDIEQEIKQKWDISKALQIVKSYKIWLLSTIILSSYCGYKGIDNYSIYLVDVHQHSLASSSLFTSIIFWLRPITALLAGVIADRVHTKIRAGRFIILFALLLMGALFQLLLALNIFTNFNYIFGIILCSATFAYALRSIYFSIFGDLKINDNLIGTTVGIVSFVGFLPDMFFGIITGHMIDSNPGPVGYTHTFLFTASFLLIGAIASFLLYRKQKF